MLDSMGIVIPKNAELIIDILQQEGFEAFIVGGAVRDALLGRTISDVDIASSAPAVICMEILKCRGISCIPTGIKHGTITAIIDDNSFEITTFRIDGSYGDKRHPDSVKFVTSIEEDLARRDFTINAMAYNESRKLVDPFGGKADLKNRLIRCVGEPKARFSEDALRILRALRFAAQLQFYIESKTACSIHELKSSILEVSSERIGTEFQKLICAKDASKIIGEFVDVFCEIIPEIVPMIGLDSHNPLHIYDGWTHTLIALENQSSSDLATRLATFFHDMGKPICDDPSKGQFRYQGHAEAGAKLATKILRRLHFPNSVIHECACIIAEHDSMIEEDLIDVRKWIGKLGPDLFFKVLDLKIADMIAHSPEAAKWVEKIKRIRQIGEKVVSDGDCVTISQLEVDGNDVLNAGIEPGPQVKFVLKKLLDQVIEGKCAQNRTDQLEAMYELIKTL